MQRKIGDLSVHYTLEGPPDAPVVMMAHAMGTNLHIWDWQLPCVVDGFRVLRYEWRGHGRTGAPEGPYRMDLFVADALGLLDALGIERVHWVGLSTGGMIGQGFAIAHPERLHSLSLCNTMCRASSWYRDWVSERHAVVRRGGMQAVWEITDRLWFTDAFVEAAGDDYRRVEAEFVKTDVGGYIAATSAVVDLDYQGLLSRIGAPTLVLAAGDDPVTPPEISELMAASIPHARLEVIEGQRHFSNVEVPEPFNHHLRGFLDAVA